MSKPDPWALFGEDDDVDLQAPVLAAAAPAAEPVAGDVESTGPSSAPKHVPVVASAPKAGAQTLLATVAIPLRRSLPHVRLFFARHAPSALDDLNRAGLTDPDAASLHAALSTLTTELGGDELDSSTLRLAAAAHSVTALAWDRLARGSWPSVAWRESYILGQLATLVCEGAAGHPLDAMEAGDLAMILGAPEEPPVQELVQLAEVACQMSISAHSALVAGRAKLGKPVVMVGAAAAPRLPTIPRVLGPDAVIDVPTITAPIPRLRVANPARSKSAAVSPPDVEHPALVALRAPLAGGKLLTTRVFRSDFASRSRPVVLLGMMNDWAALDEWRDLAGLAARQGHRCVPIEFGHHLGASWREAPLRLNAFFTEYLAPSLAWGWGQGAFTSVPANGGGVEVVPGNPPRVLVPSDRVAYLAQHGLFSQIPVLCDAFSMPTFALRDVGAVNAWWGTAGTVSRLHTDSYDNLLCQVVGYKFVRLFAPDEGRNLYVLPRTGSSDGGVAAQGNISAVNAEELSAPAFPLASKAQFVDTVLGPGDALFIPAGWWHHVRALTTSMSVSFWH